MGSCFGRRLEWGREGRFYFIESCEFELGRLSYGRAGRGIRVFSFSLEKIGLKNRFLVCLEIG